MARKAFTEELLKVMTNQKPPRATSMTQAELETTIAEISAQLQGPLSNAERLCLVEDRIELRKQLARVKTA